MMYKLYVINLHFREIELSNFYPKTFTCSNIFNYYLFDTKFTRQEVDPGKIIKLTHRSVLDLTKSKNVQNSLPKKNVQSQ